jgi:hypothetical protein
VPRETIGIQNERCRRMLEDLHEHLPGWTGERRAVARRADRQRAPRLGEAEVSRVVQVARDPSELFRGASELPGGVVQEGGRRTGGGVGRQKRGELHMAQLNQAQPPQHMQSPHTSKL